LFYEFKQKLTIFIVEKVRTGEFFAAKIVWTFRKTSTIQKFDRLKISPEIILYRKKQLRIKSMLCYSGRAN